MIRKDDNIKKENHDKNNKNDNKNNTNNISNTDENKKRFCIRLQIRKTSE